MKIRPAFHVTLIIVAVALFAGAATVAASRWRPRHEDPVAAAVARLAAAESPGFVLTRQQLAFLAAAEEVVNSRQYLDALRESLTGHGPGSLHEQLEEMNGKLAPNRQRVPEPADSGDAPGLDPVLERALVRLPRNRAPSFFHVGPPDLKRIRLDRQDSGEGGGDAPGERPAKTQESVATRAPDGTVKTVTTRYDANGQLSTRVTVVDHPDGEFEIRSEVRADRIWFRRDESGGPGWLEGRSYWRLNGENAWRPSNPWDDLTRMPAEEGTGAGGADYLVRLPNGRLARCVVLNPITGVARCSDVSADRVNPGPEPAPVIDGSLLAIDPESFVINPDPDNPPPRRAAPGGPPVLRRPGPGGRPPPSTE